MSRDYNTSNAFAASLSFGFSAETTADYSLAAEDKAIEKYAGISMYQPTIDNVEMFIRKYIMNELAGGASEGVSNIDVTLVPSRFDTLKPDYIKDAQGTVTLKVADVNLQLPFIVIDEEFLPFDIIQLDKQRIPYSRENLRKVVGGIHNQKKNISPVPEFDPYMKVEKPINPASSIGFLGDVLKIQEQHAFRTTSGGNIYVTAEESIDNALEKLAEMKPITEEDWKTLDSMVRDQVVKAEVDEIQKIAADLEKHDDSKMAMIFNKVKDMQFLDANNLPHGTIVAFPELHCKEISMNKGIIIDDYMDIAGVMPKKIKVIVSQDCRMKILDNKDRFLCFKIDPQGFRLHTRELDIIDKDDVLFAFDGNKAMVPCTVSHISMRVLKPGGEVGYAQESHTEDETRKSTAFGQSGVKIYNLTPIYNHTQTMSVFSDDGVDRTKDGDILGNRDSFKLVTLKATKFIEIPYNEFIKKKAHELGITEMLMMGLAPHYDVCTTKSSDKNGRYITEGNVVVCTDENTKIVRIKGIIKDHMRNKEDLEHMANATYREFDVMASEEEEGLDKTAELGETYDKSKWHPDNAHIVDALDYAHSKGMLTDAGKKERSSSKKDKKFDAWLTGNMLTDEGNRHFGKHYTNALATHTPGEDFKDTLHQTIHNQRYEKHLADNEGGLVGQHDKWSKDMEQQKESGADVSKDKKQDKKAPEKATAKAPAKDSKVPAKEDLKAKIKGKGAADKMVKKAGVEAMASNIDLGGDRLPTSPMPSYWVTGMDQSQKTALDEAFDELEKIAISLKAVPQQASRFKVMGSLKNTFERALDRHANRLATNDWMKLKDKGFLSPDGTRVIKPFNHMGTNMKEKGMDAIHANYKQMLAKDKSIGNSKFTKVSSEDDNGLFKTAATNEYIELRTVDKDKGTYNLTVLHVDKTKKIFKSVHREFKAIPYQEVREILKALGFGNIKISEIMQRARRENYAKYELPDDATPERLSGGQVSSGIKSTLQKVRSTIYDSNIGDSIAADMAGAILAGAAIGASGAPILSALNRVAAESGALSSAFEKIAKSNGSQSMLKVAKVMALASGFNEKVASVVSGKAQYFKLNDVVADIIEAKPALEKMASELIDLKVDQYKHKTMIVNPGYIQAAIKNIDRMYNVALTMDREG